MERSFTLAFAGLLANKSSPKF